MDYSELNNYSFELAEDYKGKKKGDTIKLSEVVNEDDTWNFERKGKAGEVNYLIVKHSALQLIKRLSGMVYYKEPELIVQPSIENNMSAVVINSMRLPKNRKYKQIDVVVGEANKTSVAIPYIVTMAYKRAYDRAVIEALELRNIYSEDEADTFEQREVTTVTPADNVEIAPYLKAVHEADTLDKLNEFGKEFAKVVNAGTISKVALDQVKKEFIAKKAQLEKGA